MKLYFYYAADKQVKGPLALATVAAMFSSAHEQVAVNVCAQGEEKWMPLALALKLEAQPQGGSRRANPAPSRAPQSVLREDKAGDGSPDLMHRIIKYTGLVFSALLLVSTIVFFIRIFTVNGKPARFLSTVCCASSFVSTWFVLLLTMAFDYLRDIRDGR